MSDAPFSLVLTRSFSKIGHESSFDDSTQETLGKSDTERQSAPQIQPRSSTIANLIPPRPVLRPPSPPAAKPVLNRSRDSFFDMESEPTRRKIPPQEEQEDDDEFFKTLGPPARPAVNTRFEDLFGTMTYTDNHRRFTDSD